MKMLSGSRRLSSRALLMNLVAGRILPRAIPLMSGTRHSTSSILRSVNQSASSVMMAVPEGTLGLPCRPKAWQGGPPPGGPPSVLSQEVLRRGVFQVQRLGDRLVDDMAVMDVEAVAQMRIVVAGLTPTLVRERNGEGQRGVVEGEGRGPRDTPGHVGDAVVDDAVDHIGRVGMGGGMAGLEAAALIDGDVHQHRTGTHALDHLAGHQLR